MNQPTNFCPLHGHPCVEDRCAWWDFGGNECVMVAAAIALGEVAANLEDIQHKTAAVGGIGT